MITIKDILFWGTMGILIFFEIWIIDILMLLLLGDF